MSSREAIREFTLRPPTNKSGFLRSDSHELNNADLVNFFVDQVAIGRETYPLNVKCGTPYGHGPLCAGFKFEKGGACPGYPSIQQEAA